MELIRASINNDLKMVEQLLKDGIDVNQKNDRGMSSLHISSSTVNIALASLLLKNGADIEAKDNQGNTPLWTATMFSKGNEEMILYLLKNGADQNAKNLHGISPVELANNISNYMIKAFEKRNI